MERDDDGEADDSHIDAQAEVREECSFICAVISGIAVDIFEEQGAEQRRCAEDGIAEVLAQVLVVQRARHDEYAEFMGS